MMSKTLFSTVRLSKWLVLSSILLTGVFASNQAMGQSVWSAEEISWNYNGTQFAVARGSGGVDIGVVGGVTTNFDVFDDSVNSVAWNPSLPTLLAVATGSSLGGELRVFDTNALQLVPLFSIDLYGYGIARVRWSPDGRQLATIGETGGGASSISTLRLWDVNNGTVLYEYGAGHVFTDLSWNPANSNQVLLSGLVNFYGANLTLLDVQAQAVLWQRSEPEQGPINVAWKPNGSVFVTASRDYDPEIAIVRLHDGISGDFLMSVPTTISYVGTLTWNPNEYLAISGDDVIEIWNVAAMQMVSSLSVGLVSAMAWSPTGDLTYVQTVGTVQIVGGLGQVPTPTLTFTPTFTLTPTLTFTPTPAAYQRLRLTSVCSADPALTRRWRVRNSNPYDVAFTWDVYGTAQTGSGVAPAAQGGAPGEVFFETQTAAGTPNTTRLAVNGVQQDVKASGGAACP